MKNRFSAKVSFKGAVTTQKLDRKKIDSNMFKIQPPKIDVEGTLGGDFGWAVGF